MAGVPTAVFTSGFREDLLWWLQTDRRMVLRVLPLVEAVLTDPCAGMGKPEPLRYQLAGCWSRSISQEHRLVYRVAADHIDFLQARYHYE